MNSVCVEYSQSTTRVLNIQSLRRASAREKSSRARVAARRGGDGVAARLVLSRKVLYGHFRCVLCCAVLFHYLLASGLNDRER